MLPDLASPDWIDEGGERDGAPNDDTSLAVKGLTLLSPSKKVTPALGVRLLLPSPGVTPFASLPTRIGSAESGRNGSCREREVESGGALEAIAVAVADCARNFFSAAAKAALLEL